MKGRDPRMGGVPSVCTVPACMAGNIAVAAGR